ncbi:hypothetical protein D3C84_1282570 [compost metagenome]
MVAGTVSVVTAKPGRAIGSGLPDVPARPSAVPPASVYSAASAPLLVDVSVVGPLAFGLPIKIR